MAWLTYFFLPRWTSTPALFFFANALATMLVDWSLRPVPALAAPWLACLAAMAAHALFADWRCIVAAHLLAGALLVVAVVLRLSPPVAAALFAGAAAAAGPALTDACALRHPFGAV